MQKLEEYQMKRLFCVMVLVIGWGAPCTADPLDDATAAMVDQIKTRKPLDDSAIRNASPAAAYKALRPYLTDAAESVRSHTVSWIVEVMANAKDPKERGEGLDILLGIVAQHEPPGDAVALAGMLKVTHRQDFNDEQRNKIGALLADHPYRDLILVAGIAAADSYKEPLRKMATGTPLELARNAQLALGRMGEREQSQAFVDQFRHLPTIQKLGRFDQLGYLRTAEAIDALKECLFGEEEIKTQGDILGVKLSTLALEQLAKLIHGFPIPTKAFYTDKDVADARQWMKAHQNFEVIQ
jgi:hypothetical protein